MTKKDHHLNERGIAHLGLIVLIVAVVAVGYFAYSRVKSMNEGNISSSSSSPANNDQNTKDEAAINSAEQQASSSSSDLSNQETVNVTQ